MPLDFLVFPGTATFPELETEKWKRWYLSRYSARDWNSSSEYVAVGAHDPLLGWDHHIDGKRYRSTRTYDKGPPTDALRVIAIGDSFTYGEQVGSQDSYPAHLESLLGGQNEVINMGVRGYGLDQMALKFSQYGREYRPDVVVVGFFEPDYYRSSLTFYMGAKPRFRRDEKEDRLQLGFTPVPPPDQMYAYLKQAYPPFWCRSCTFLRILAHKNLAHVKNPDLEQDFYREWDWVQGELLRAMRDEIRELGAKMVVLYIPIGDEFESSERLESAASSRTHNWFTATAKELGIEVVDLLEELPRRYGAKTVHEKFYFPGGHFTAEGNAVVAQILYSKIKNEVATRD